MSRVQLALRVTDLDAAIDFYGALLHARPAKRRPGYANFGIDDPPLKLVLLEAAESQVTELDHLGIEVDSSDEVKAADRRLAAAGLPTDTQLNTRCCYAVQDKVWVTGPGREPWEIYTVISDDDSCCVPAGATECCG